MLQHRMVNMFVPGSLDDIVKERAEEIRLKQRKAGQDEYVPEWVALITLLDDGVKEEFDERHDGDLTSIDLIAESTGESIRIEDPGGD